jgi:type II secretory pathway component PulF
MAIEEVLNQTTLIPTEVITELSFWVKTIGGILTIYIIFMIITLILKIKDSRNIRKIKKDMDKVKKKLKIKD